MSTSRSHQEFPGIRHWLDTLSDAGGSDAELLERFLSARDPAAIETILRRHGPMVLGVCRRILGNGSDVDDAFQATFLVLVRRAHVVRPRGALGNWLYGVACRTALKAKSMNQRWHAKRRRADRTPSPPTAEPDRDALAALDEELAALPEHYRAVVVLCELEGKTVKEAARQLGVPQGTVASRLNRGRTLLAERLRGRGLALPAAGLATLAAPVSSPLLAATLDSVQRLAAGASLTASATAPVASLTRKVLEAMLLNKLKLVVAMLLALALLVGTAGLALTSASSAPPPPPVAAQDAESEPALVADEPPVPKAPAKPDPGQDLLDGLDRTFCRALAALVKQERDAGKPVTSPALVREVIKTFPKDDRLADLARSLEKEKAGKDEASDAIRDLLAEYSFRYGYCPPSLDAQLTREQLRTFADRQAALARLGQRFGGRDAVKWADAQKEGLAEALQRVNDHRKRAGLKALPTDVQPDVPARKHATYLDLNRDGDRFHDDQPVDDQLPGRPGYSYNGRLLAGSTLVGLGKPVDVVDGWMATLPGRCALLRPDLAELRIARVLSTPPGKGFRGPLVVARYSNVKDVTPEEKAVVVVPEDGAKDVPLRMLDQRPSLVPADAPHDRQGRAEVGYPVSVTFWGAERIAKVQATLQRRQGERWETVPVYLSSPEQPARPDTWVCNLGTVCLVPRQPLAAQASYRAEFRAEVDGKPFEKVITFHTGKPAPAADVPAFKYNPPTNNNLNNAFRYRVGLLLGSERHFLPTADAQYLAALDGAFYRLALWRARWEQREGNVVPWQPLLELARDWAPGRKEIATLLPTIDRADKPFPAEGLDLVADHALRYRDLAKHPDAPRAVRDLAEKRQESLLSFHRKHGGKGPDELETRTRRMAEQGLVVLNDARKRLKLPEVELDPRLSRACRNHAVYIDLNRGEGPASWTFWGRPTPHEAERGLPGYTEAGAFAGMTSDIAFGTPERCVRGWLCSFFHRIPLLNPDAKQIGIGFTWSADAFATGTGKVALLSVPAITRRSTTRTVVLYPESGAKGLLRNYGLESPNPIAKPEKKDARGWPIAGFPVTATFFGHDKITKATGKLLLKKGGTWEEVPAYFSSPEQPAAYFGDNLKTLCLMAKDWLAADTTYRAEFTAVVDGKEWRGETTFTTGGEKALVEEK